MFKAYRMITLTLAVMVAYVSVIVIVVEIACHIGDMFTGIVR